MTMLKIETEKQKRFVALLEEIEKGSALKFFTNCPNPRSTLGYIADSYDFLEVLGYQHISFKWADSEEGCSYWRRIYEELGRMPSSKGATAR